MSKRPLQALVIACAAYIAAHMLADVASLRILSIAGLTVSGGALIYPFTFTLRDLVHRAGSAVVARTLIFTSAAINLVMAGLFWLVAELPPDAALGEQAEFGFVLSPVWRIVFASIAAEIVSQLLDTEVYAAWQRRYGQRRIWGRALASNALSAPVDAAIFSLVAFWGVLPPEATLTLFASNLVVMYALAFASVPAIYLVKGDSAERK